MTQNAYELIALAMRYFFAGMMLLIVLRAGRGALIDSRRAARLRRLSPMAGVVGELVVIEGDGRIRRGMRYPVIREGLIGSSRKADLSIRHPSVRRRHAYFQLTENGLRVRGHAGAKLYVAKHTPVREILIGDGGSFAVGKIRLLLVLGDGRSNEDELFEPHSPAIHSAAPDESPESEYAEDDPDAPFRRPIEADDPDDLRADEDDFADSDDASRDQYESDARSQRMADSYSDSRSQRAIDSYGDSRDRHSADDYAESPYRRASDSDARRVSADDSAAYGRRAADSYTTSRSQRAADAYSDSRSQRTGDAYSDSRDRHSADDYAESPYRRAGDSDARRVSADDSAAYGRRAADTYNDSRSQRTVNAYDASRRSSSRADERRARAFDDFEDDYDWDGDSSDDFSDGDFFTVKSDRSRSARRADSERIPRNYRPARHSGSRIRRPDDEF